MTRIFSIALLVLCLGASTGLANTGSTGSMAEVKTEVDDLLSIVWMVVAVGLVLYGLYELIKFGTGSGFTGGSLVGIVTFIIGATVMVYVVPKFSDKAVAYGATIEEAVHGSCDERLLGQ